MSMDPVIVGSARKHGVQDEDMLHAYRNPIRVFEVDDLVMLVGADESGRMLEIVLPTQRASSSSSTPCQPARST
jgi:hypothetical protein